MTIPSCTVERSQLILQKREVKQIRQEINTMKCRLSNSKIRLGNVEDVKLQLSTLVLASICAPLSSNSLTIITLPLLEAI